MLRLTVEREVNVDLEETWKSNIPSKIEWDFTNGPLSKLVELLVIRYAGLGVRET